ncbi:MAG: hypothetical protein ACYT04_57255 [Nostoc sp.]
MAIFNPYKVFFAKLPDSIQVNYRLDRQWLSESAIAQHIAATQPINRLHRLQLFSPKSFDCRHQNHPQRVFWRL